MAPKLDKVSSLATPCQDGYRDAGAPSQGSIAIDTHRYRKGPVVRLSHKDIGAFDISLHRPCSHSFTHMSRRVQRAPRKRTGCATCKNAHVSCTEEKPACKRCQRLSLECQYEFKLLWEEDALQRNIAHGRCGVWTRDGKKTEPTLSTLQLADEQEELAWISLSPKAEWSFTNFAPKDFFNGLPAALQHNVLPEQDFESETQRVHWSASIFEEPNVTGSSREPRRCAITDNNGPETTDANTIALMNTQETDLPATKSIDIALPRLIPSCMPILSISKMDCQLLDYYIHELSPKCSLSAQLNPYLHTLLPVAYEFEPLRHTLLAASACQLYLASGDRQYELCSLDHRSKAIRGLNKHIYKNHVDWRSLATMVMFCFRDVRSSCPTTRRGSTADKNRSRTAASHHGLPI